MIATHSITRVLVPYNFSESSASALAVAIHVCKRHNAGLTILNVTTGSPAVFTAASGVVANIVATDRLQTMNARLRKVADDIAGNSGLEVNSIVRTGEPVDRVCDWAMQDGTSLIIVGIDRSFGLFKALFESVAEEILRKAPCAVLTVPAKSNRINFKKILFPVRTGIDPIDKYAQTKAFVRVNNSSVIIDAFTSSYRYSSYSKLNDLMEELVDEVSKDSVSCAGFIRHTHDPARSVLLAAEVHDSDLIVITATNDSSFKNFLYKPYTKYIVNHSSVPVLCIQPAKLPSRLSQSVA